MFEFRMNAIREIFFGELEQVIQQLQRSYGGGIDWVDEPEEDFEDFCGLRNVDCGESGVTRGGLGWLREGEHVVEYG